MVKAIPKQKKAQMWWYIIGFVLAAIVLVISVIILSGKAGQVSTATSQCKGFFDFGEKQGVCKPICEPGEIQATGFGSDCKENEKCCIAET